MSNFLGGNSKQSSTSTSSNQAYPFLQSALGSNVGSVGSSMGAIQALLSGDTSGLDAFKNATGFNAQTKAGSQGITGNAAASGLLRSGSTGKALANYGNQMNSQATQNYLGQLGSLAGLGLQSAGLIGQAGQTSSSTGTTKSKSGLGGLF